MLFVRRPLRILPPLVAAIVVGSAVFGLFSFGAPASPGSRSANIEASAPSAALVEASGTPSDCSQGSHVITVPPSTPALATVLLADYDTLGALGGGTIHLEAGTYTLEATLVFRDFGNISIEGAGEGQTILSMPKDPVGNFTSTTGHKLGLWNFTRDRVVDGGVADFIRVDGPAPIDNFEMCDLTLRANANSASEDWDGSMLFDSSGGQHHVYENLALTDFYGPSTIPNGIHLEDFSGKSKAYNYVVDNVTADNNTLPFSYSRWVVGGPNFLNIGPIVDCAIENVRAIGLLAFELAPPRGCVIENTYISGHLEIDPVVGGSWGGTLFQNVTVDSRNTAAPNAMGTSVANGTAHGSSTFSDLRWNDDTFYGTVLHGENMVDVENSSFFGGLNDTPAIFTHNYVNLTDGSPNRVDLPVEIDGAPAGGRDSNVSYNTFVFPNSTFRLDPFVLNVPVDSWWKDAVEIYGESTGYLLQAPGLRLARASVLSDISYDSLGDGSPTALTLMDLANSPEFADLGASVGNLNGIQNDLPHFAPNPPKGLHSLYANTSAVGLAWQRPSGNVTNYTVYSGTSPSSLRRSMSAGLHTSFAVGGLRPATTYYFDVEAWNATFHSTASEQVKLTTRQVPQYAPGTPSGLGAGSIGPTYLDLNWDASTGNVTNYTVLVGVSSTGWDQKVSAGPVPTFNMTGLDPNSTYYLAVMAWNTTWASAPSSPVMVTTLPKVVTNSNTSTSSNSTSSDSSGNTSSTNSSGTTPPSNSSTGSSGSNASRGGITQPVRPVALSLETRLLMVGMALGVIAGIVGALAVTGYVRTRRRRRSRRARRARS
jgi:hypothetical protein